MPKRHDKARVARAVSKKAGVRFRSGSEQTGPVVLDGKRVFNVTVPKGRGDLTPGTQNAIRDQLKLSRDDFTRLVDCTMTGTDYMNLLREMRAQNRI